MRRREVLKTMAAVTATAAIAGPLSAATREPGAMWISTTRKRPWRTMPTPVVRDADPNFFRRDLEIAVDRPAQTITGFGGAFSERGWDALATMTPERRDAVVAALFARDGAGFSICRTTIGANDFSRRWYSYAETPGDFALDRFDLGSDRETLIPFIRAARVHAPDLKVWGSPWSPPVWMKTNGHYAMTPAYPGQPSNGLLPEQRGREGRDFFIQDDRYFDAYARYFRRYVEEYARAGVRISAVMPQNEFNSAQPFPSCCWTPEGLARFLPFLGREMGKVGVDILFGTLERPNIGLVKRALAEPATAAFVKGIGVQWAGKGALHDIGRDFPAMAIWGTEQECGDGANDWRYARYAWDLIKRYMLAGAGAYHHWNMVLPTDQLSTWGLPQNSLVTVDSASGRARYNHEYHLMRHLSQFVRPGAVRLPTDSFFGFENLLAFRNADGGIVIVIQNDLGQPQRVRMKFGPKQVDVDLPADSFNTLLV
jgi:glucosylceramidase